MSSHSGGLFERRRAPRSAATAKAYVSRQGFPRYRGTVRDLSRSGAFVDTGPLPIPEQHVVHLDLVSDHGRLAYIERRPAIVVRRSAQGTALKFF